MVVGKIDNHDVIYIPEKEVVFCKNTTLNYKLIKKIIQSPIDRTEISEKNLTVTKTQNLIKLGCLTTTRENIEEIEKNIKKLKRNES